MEYNCTDSGFHGFQGREKPYERAKLSASIDKTDRGRKTNTVNQLLHLLEISGELR